MGTFLQDTLSGDVIDLKTYPCRIVEQDGIISPAAPPEDARYEAVVDSRRSIDDQ
jgi:hypothetical protein